MRFVIKDNQRDSQYELLRIVAMLMIVLHHVIVHGIPLLTPWGDSHLLNARLSGTEQNLFFFADTFVIYGVCLFILISGYYGIKVSVRKFLSLYLLVCFYNLANLLLIAFSTPSVTFLDCLHAFMPFSHSHSWFVKAYFYLFFLSPLLNFFICKSGRAVLLSSIAVFAFTMFIVGFLFNRPPFTSGYNAWLFLFLYLIGGYIRRYVSVRSCQSSSWLWLFIGCSFSLFLLFVITQHFFAGHPSLPFHLLWYNNPLILFGSVCLFLYFSHIHFHNRYVNWMASAMFSVYLIQEGAEFIFTFDVYHLIGSIYQQHIAMFVPFLLTYILILLVLSILSYRGFHAIISCFFKLLHL